MPVSRALDIIDSQVKAGRLDGNYFDIFVQARLFDSAQVSAHAEVGVSV